MERGGERWEIVSLQVDLRVINSWPGSVGRARLPRAETCSLSPRKPGSVSRFSGPHLSTPRGALQCGPHPPFRSPPLWCIGSGAARLALFEKTAPIESNTHKVVSGSMITLRACRGAEQRKEDEVMKASRM